MRQQSRPDPSTEVFVYRSAVSFPPCFFPSPYVVSAKSRGSPWIFPDPPGQVIHLRSGQPFWMRPIRNKQTKEKHLRIVWASSKGPFLTLRLVEKRLFWGVGQKIKPPGYGPQVLLLGSICQGLRHFGVTPFLTPAAMGTLPHSFQGSFFSENHQNPRGNSWFLKRTMMEKNGKGITP